MHRELRPTDRLLLLPNHPTHADAPIMVEACRQAQCDPRFMAAYDVFLRSRLTAFIMQRLGAFSVDREGSSSRAMKRAMAILDAPTSNQAGDLTIFPEGNVYLQNDRLTPFHDGAGFLALRAAESLAKRDIRLLAVPVSIRVTHVTDVRSAVRDRLMQLGDDLASPIDPRSTPLSALQQVGLSAIRRNLKHRGLAMPTELDLPTLIREGAGQVLTRLELKLDLAPDSHADLIGRVRSVRQMIHQIRIDPARQADHAAARTWADEAMLAFRIISYSGDYVAAHPTIDRIAQTAEKLAEDVYGRKLPPLGDRDALVQFNDPIDTARSLATSRTRRQTIEAFTHDVEIAVQQGLDQIRSETSTVGSQLWTTALGDA